MTPQYNETGNSTVTLYSSVDNIYDNAIISDIQECKSGFLILGTFVKIGERDVNGIALWNGK